MSTGPASPRNLEELFRRVKARNADPKPRKLGCGCLTGITGAILAGLAILLLFNPWALHIGGRLTPALTWHGVGELRSSTGATYGLYLEVSPLSDSESSDNIVGKAKICTPQGETYPLTVSGYIKAWLSTDGRPVSFSLGSLKNSKPDISFALSGAWHGQELVLEDRGSMSMSFSRDGTAKGYMKGPNAPKESTTGSLRYATEAELVTVCGDKAKSSF